METKEARRSTNWLKRLVNLKSRYRLRFSYSLKTASDISRVIAIFSAVYAFSLVYELFFQMTHLASFHLSISDIDIFPFYQSNGAVFYSLLSLELAYALIATAGFWNLNLFLKSIDAQRPFANLNSKKYISRVAYMAQAFFLAKLLFLLIRMQTPDLLVQQPVSDKTGFFIFLNTSFLFPFNYLILAYFTSIFSQLFKRGIVISDELKDVI